MQLKIETKTTHSIDFFDWDSFIKKTYPNCPYDSIVAEEEMTNDSVWAATIKGSLDEKEIARIEAYLLEGDVGEYWETSTTDVLNYLVHKGVLSEGYYNIKISW